MIDEQNSNFDENPEILKHFNLLNELGIFAQIENLKSVNQDKNDLINEAFEIFRKDSVVELVNYITSLLLNKFIPEKMAFVIQKELEPNKAQILCFENMKPVEMSLEIKSLRAYKNYFKYFEACSLWL